MPSAHDPPLGRMEDGKPGSTDNKNRIRELVAREAKERLSAEENGLYLFLDDCRMNHYDFLRAQKWPRELLDRCLPVNWSRDAVRSAWRRGIPAVHFNFAALLPSGADLASLVWADFCTRPGDSLERLLDEARLNGARMVVVAASRSGAAGHSVKAALEDREKPFQTVKVFSSCMLVACCECTDATVKGLRSLKKRMRADLDVWPDLGLLLGEEAQHFIHLYQQLREREGPDVADAARRQFVQRQAQELDKMGNGEVCPSRLELEAWWYTAVAHAVEAPCPPPRKRRRPEPWRLMWAH